MVNAKAILGMVIGIYFIAYAGVPALREMANETALLTGVTGSLMSVLLPLIIVFALITLFMKGRK